MKTAFSGLLILATIVWCSTSFAAPPERLNWGQMLNSQDGGCSQSGTPIISVVEKVKGDVDSGFGGYWAYDSFSRTIKVWAQGGSVYCAVVEYHGQFHAIEGANTPAGTGGTLSGEEDGAFEGGYVATITGTLLSQPKWKANGSVGSYDYACTSNGSDCPGYVDWVGQYFVPGYGFDQPTWGWVYHGGPDGTWVNASTGSSGNIQ